MTSEPNTRETALLGKLATQHSGHCFRHAGGSITVAELPVQLIHGVDENWCRNHAVPEESD